MNTDLKPHDSQYPRVLIIGSSALDVKSATGITLCSLFSGYPKECISQIYDDVSAPNPEYCSCSYRLSSADIPIIHALKKIHSGYYLYKRPLSKDNGKSKHGGADNSISKGLLGAMSDVYPFRLSEHLINWIDAFKPDVIYSPLGNVRWINVVIQVCQRFDLSVIPHFMDDWPLSEYSSSKKLWFAQRILNSRLKVLLGYSPVSLTISRDMAEEYKVRYSGDFRAFMNCAVISPLRETRTAISQSIVRFAYIGGLHLNRWKALNDVVHALQQIKDLGRAVIVDICAPEKDLVSYSEVFSSYDVIGQITTIRPSDVDEKLAHADVLIHVESFLPKDTAKTKLSISTKIPQYMAAGKAILAYGPPELSSIRYVSQSGAGVAVTVEGDLTGLFSIADQLVVSSAYREELGQSGYRHAKEKHSREIVSKNFRAALIEVAQSSQCNRL